MMYFFTLNIFSNFHVNQLLSKVLSVDFLYIFLLLNDNSVRIQLKNIKMNYLVVSISIFFIISIGIIRNKTHFYYYDRLILWTVNLVY